jgi:inorganic phosphate transporter, PiT family
MRVPTEMPVVTSRSASTRATNSAVSRSSTASEIDSCSSSRAALILYNELGLGTMIGWRRIVRTVAERIGKTHLAYAQGASAELTTMGTILLADNFGLPVSTTHVLTSGIAGTMVANQSGVQKNTIRNILLAWVLTLPVCFFLGATLFAGMLFLFFNVIGWK